MTPNIEKAALEIWYDNGMINRFEPEAEKLEKLKLWLKTIDAGLIENVEAFLSTLSADDLSTLCCGDEDDQCQIASEDIQLFLGRIFDEEYEEVK